MKTRLTTILIAAGLAGGVAPTHAIVVTPDSSASSLATALTAGTSGLTVIGTPTLSGNSSGGAVSSGTYTNASGTYGIGPGIVLSSGDVADYSDGPNTDTSNTTHYGAAASAAQETLLDPITGGGFDHFDVTQLDIDFTTSTGEVFFDVVFGSEEFDEFVGSSFIDGFGLFLDGTNIAFSGGDPVNIDHPDMAFLPGTELDGILAPGGDPRLTFAGTGLDTSITHSLTFIVADTSDTILDTTTYIASLGGTPTSPVPEPASLALIGLGLAGLGATRRRKRLQAA